MVPYASSSQPWFPERRTVKKGRSIPTPSPIRPVQARGEGRDAIDLHVGERMRARRTELGMSLADMSAQMSISTQQVQKYESGQNRISASRLWQLSQMLGVPVCYFYAGLDEGAAGTDTPQADVAELVQAYCSIEDHALRESAVKLMQSLCSKGSSKDLS